MKLPDWQINNYKAMHLMRIVLLIPILIMFAAVFYSIASGEAGDINTYIIFILAIPAILPLFIISPEYIQILVKDDRFIVNRRHILHPRKSDRLNILVKDIEKVRVERKDSFFNSRLIIEYVHNGSSQTMNIPLINFNLRKKGALVKHIHSI